MLALVKDQRILAIELTELALAPAIELHGGDVVPVIEFDLPSGHILDGAVRYELSDGIVYQRATSTPAFSNYAETRKLMYPPITDYIDGIVKNDTAQINAYIAACLAVKAKYPKT
jgi:hypothetical protein